MNQVSLQGLCRRKCRAGSTLSGPRRAPAASRRRSRFCKGGSAEHRPFDRFESSSVAQLSRPPLHAVGYPRRVLFTCRDSLLGRREQSAARRSNGEKKTERQISSTPQLAALSRRLLSPDALIDAFHHSSNSHSPSTTDSSASKENMTASAVVGSAYLGGPPTARPVPLALSADSLH